MRQFNQHADHTDHVSSVVLIPALNPDAALVETVRGCMELGLNRVLIVDDGSGEAYQGFFSEAEKLGAYIVHHSENRGKGAALKTGLLSASEQFPDLDGVVTADADGQHAPKDIRSVRDAMASHPESLVLGERNLKSPQTPCNSRIGNGFSSCFFRMATGVRCDDTQTGLRGIPRALFAEALEIPGDRYDYEMNFLMKTTQRGRELFPVPIETIYRPGNSSSHFRVVRDSALIYQQPLKYAAVSLSSAVIDLGGFVLLTKLVFGRTAAGIYASTIIARCLSGYVNFKLNQIWCFQPKKRTAAQLGRYSVLFVCTMLVSATLVWLAKQTPLPLGVIKAIVDALLFLFNYFAQRRWVFAEGKDAR